MLFDVVVTIVAAADNVDVADDNADDNGIHGNDNDDGAGDSEDSFMISLGTTMIRMMPMFSDLGKKTSCLLMIIMVVAVIVVMPIEIVRRVVLIVITIRWKTLTTWRDGDNRGDDVND